MARLKINRIYVRRGTIILGSLFWVCVMIVGGYSFRQIHYDNPFQALHHLSVGIFLFLASFLAIYCEAWKSRGDVTFREYFVHHQLAALAYLLTAGFIVDPFPATHEMPSHIQTLFYTAAILGCLNAVIKSTLGCLKPGRHSVISNREDDRREQARSDSSPMRRTMDEEEPPMFIHSNSTASSRLLRSSDHDPPATLYSTSRSSTRLLPPESKLNPFDALPGSGSNRNNIARGTSTNVDFDNSYNSHKASKNSKASDRQSDVKKANPFTAEESGANKPLARSDTNPFKTQDTEESPSRDAAELKRAESNPFEK